MYIVLISWFPLSSRWELLSAYPVKNLLILGRLPQLKSTTSKLIWLQKAKRLLLRLLRTILMSSRGASADTLIWKMSLSAGYQEDLLIF
ncbi:eukaryotic translation initiation factor 2 (eIF-2) family protein [Zea mays]|uniref:Eukaryotic translation initiation factor 2 (eIF-2) family protein n=1 Tax=Zea mays TaxID=4577 RepID=A0A1D6FLL4_MAIZE|nr:eukaryotic translation initiation factor 2 (eIF-2) family protein [Zea mays]